jgi:tetratricopeptide (TPR) repeat protein
VRTLADTFMFKVHDAIAPLPGAVEARGLLVETALEYLNTLAPEAGDDRSLQLDLAKAYSKVADYQGQAYNPNVGKQREAIASYGKSIELAEFVTAAEPNNVSAQEVLGIALRAQGRLLLIIGETKGALEISARALSIFERLAKRQPGSASSRNLVNAYLARGLILDYTGDEAGTRVVLGKAIALMEQVYQNSPNDLDVARQLNVAYSTYASTMLGPTRDDAAIDELVAAHAKALAVSERVMQESPAANVHVINNLIGDHGNLVLALNIKGDFREAYAHCQRGRELARLLNADTSNAQRSIDKAQAETHCARALRGLGEHAESERVTREVYAILERLEKENDNLYVTFHFGAALELLGSFSEQRRDWSRAREQYAKALERFKVVQDAVTLDYGDIAWIDQARTGLARVEGRLAER